MESWLVPKRAKNNVKVSNDELYHAKILKDPKSKYLFDPNALPLDICRTKSAWSYAMMQSNFCITINDYVTWIFTRFLKE